MNAGEGQDRARQYKAVGIMECTGAHEREVLGGRNIYAGGPVLFRIDMAHDRASVRINV